MTDSVQGICEQPDLVLVNPAAGGGRARVSVPHLCEFAKERGWNAEICLTHNPDDLMERAKSAAQAGRKRIFVVGGDGTFQLLLNALANYRDVILGVLPAGGGNDLASALGLPPDPVQAAALLLHGEVCQLDAVRVRTADGNERLYSGGGGVGVDAEAARYANGALRNMRGRLRYVLAALRALLGFHAMRVRVLTNGDSATSVEDTVLLAAVLNTPSYGAGLCLAPEAKTDDGKLDVVILKKLRLMEILELLPGFVTRSQLKSSKLHRTSAASVRIETDVPHWFHGDGELLGMTPVEISVVPLAFCVIRAARTSKI